MKSLLSIFVLSLFLLTGTLQAQQQYTVEGQNYTLKTEVEGPLTLLWNSIDGEYRYFLKKDDEIVELKNTKQNGHFQEEYKDVLRQETADAPVSADKINLTVPSLHKFVAQYNKTKDPNFSEDKPSVDLQLRLGAFVGVTNSVYTENTYNMAQALAGVDLELTDAVKLKRHSMVLRFKQTIRGNSYKYSASQLSLNYRFKFVKTTKFDAFVNCKFASLTYSKTEVDNSNPEDPAPHVFIKETVSGTDFNAPITFGIGADYKVGDGYITFNYNDIVGLSVESNGEFPVDFTVGYKFNL